MSEPGASDSQLRSVFTSSLADSLRQLNVSYGVGAFGFFNRLQLDAQVTSTERERLLSSEAEIPVQRLEERAAIDLRLELRPRLFLRGAAGTASYRYDDSILDERPPGRAPHAIRAARPTSA